jgi:hypothetical protein
MGPLLSFAPRKNTISRGGTLGECGYLSARDPSSPFRGAKGDDGRAMLPRLMGPLLSFAPAKEHDFSRWDVVRVQVSFCPQSVIALSRSERRRWESDAPTADGAIVVFRSAKEHDFSRWDVARVQVSFCPRPVIALSRSERRRWESEAPALMGPLLSFAPRKNTISRGGTLGECGYLSARTPLSPFRGAKGDEGR